MIGRCCRNQIFCQVVHCTFRVKEIFGFFCLSNLEHRLSFSVFCSAQASLCRTAQKMHSCIKTQVEEMTIKLSMLQYWFDLFCLLLDCALPFSWEVLTDWTVTSTSMNLFMWFKLEDGWETTYEYGRNATYKFFNLKAKMETIKARRSDKGRGYREVFWCCGYTSSFLETCCQDAQQGLYKTKCDMNARKYVRRCAVQGLVVSDHIFLVTLFFPSPLSQERTCFPMIESSGHSWCTVSKRCSILVNLMVKEASLNHTQTWGRG